MRVAYISRMRSLRVALFFALEGKLTHRDYRVLLVAKSKLINIIRRRDRMRYNKCIMQYLLENVYIRQKRRKKKKKAQ